MVAAGYVEEGYTYTDYVQEGVTVIWSTKEIFIPKDMMLLTQTSPVEVRQLDLYDLHMTLRSLEAAEAGMMWDYTHNYQPPLVISGVPLARVVDITNDYTVTFENGLYNVNVTNGNSNISDRVNKNSVGVNTANSAGLQDLSSLQAASFSEGAVALWQGYGTDGTTFPIGTKGKPANSWSDARSIMSSRNMDTMIILGSATAGVGDDLSNLIVKGTNPMLSSLYVSDEANTANLYVRELFFNGYLDGGAVLRDCVVGTVYYFNGYIEHCALVSGTIYVNGVGVLLNCAAGATCVSAPILDMTDALGLAVRNYNGNLKIVNKTGNSACQIDMTGILEIDASCTSGGITVTGDCKVIDNSTGTFVLNDQSTGSPKDVADAVMSRGVATKGDVYAASLL